MDNGVRGTGLRLNETMPIWRQANLSGYTKKEMSQLHGTLWRGSGVGLGFASKQRSPLEARTYGKLAVQTRVPPKQH